MLGSERTETLHGSGNDSDIQVSRETLDRSKASPSLVTRPARADDIIEYFGGPQRGTMKAVVAVLDGKVVGFLGVIREGPIGKYFCDISPELQPHLQSITILRAIKASMEFVKQYRGPLVAIAEHAEGCRILNRLGFIHLDGAYYRWLR